MNCPNCNKEVSPEWELCPFCGYKPKKCSNPQCNSGWLRQEARFCPECGSKVEGDASSVIEKPVPKPEPAPQKPKATSVSTPTEIQSKNSRSTSTSMSSTTSSVSQKSSYTPSRSPSSSSSAGKRLGYLFGSIFAGAIGVVLIMDGYSIFYGIVAIVGAIILFTGVFGN